LTISCSLLELHDGYLPIVQLAQILGQGNIIFGDCCFGGQRTGEAQALTFVLVGSALNTLVFDVTTL